MSAALDNDALLAVAALRKTLWAAGFRPVPLRTGDKNTYTKGWPEKARQNPPLAVTEEPTADYLNTGLLGRRLADRRYRRRLPPTRREHS
jgi:hypothetical protein